MGRNLMWLVLLVLCSQTVAGTVTGDDLRNWQDTANLSACQTEKEKISKLCEGFDIMNQIDGIRKPYQFASCDDSNFASSGAIYNSRSSSSASSIAPAKDQLKKGEKVGARRRLIGRLLREELAAAT